MAAAYHVHPASDQSAAMQVAEHPADEDERLRTLRELRVLDTGEEDAYDAIARMASRQSGCPIALVSLVDADRQWFKAAVGLPVRQTPREPAFCAHAILGSEPFVVENAALDPRFADNPLVTGPPHIRFYAGAPLEVDGRRLGTVCAIDTVPRSADARLREQLQDLARMTSALLDARLRERRWLSAEADGLQSAWAALFDQAPQPMWLYDAHSLRYVRVNRAAEAMYGRGEQALQGQSLLDLCPRHEMLRLARQALGEAPAAAPLAWRQRGADGRLLHLELRLSAALRFGGRQVRLAIASDAGERRRHVFRHRLAELAGLERRATERARRAQRRFLSRASHELRTPLNAIMGFAQLLALGQQHDPRAPAGAARYAEHIVNAGHELLGLVDALLDMQQLDSGRATLQLRPVELGALAHRLADLLAPLAMERGVTLHCEAAAPAWCLADEPRLRHALLNLAANAVLYNLPRGLVTLAASAGARGQALFRISDNGVGMDDAALAALQLPLGALSGERMNGHGTGLGFAIARSLIEGMGGTLRVRSRPGAGTQASVTLRLASAAAADTANAA